MGTIEIEGETREDALVQGLARLGLREEDVDVETVETGKRFFGFLGRSSVRLRIHYEDGSLRLTAAREALERLISNSPLSFRPDGPDNVVDERIATKGLQGD